MRFALALFAALALMAPAQAQKVYSQAELDALLAPVALQPDGVVSQVLIAATYPADVSAAAAWSRANPHLKGDEAVRAVEQEPWDPAVKSLVAFPELLQRMAESPSWLADLGQAFLTQEPQVMDTVQGLRHRAQANGQLTSSGQTVVYQQGDAIVVQPRTEVVYVRYYDPYVVYGPWWWPYYAPVVWAPWRPYPVVVAHGFFYTRPVWHQHYVAVVHRPVYAHNVHVVPGRWQHQTQMRPAHAWQPRQSPSTRPYNRVPESQRKPIVQQHYPNAQQAMPAANGWSSNGPKREPMRAPQLQQQQQRQPQQPPRAQQQQQPRVQQQQQHPPQRQAQAPQRQSHPVPQREHRAIEPRREAGNGGSRGRESRGPEPRGQGNQRGHRG